MRTTAAKRPEQLARSLDDVSSKTPFSGPYVVTGSTLWGIEKRHAVFKDDSHPTIRQKYHLGKDPRSIFRHSYLEPHVYSHESVQGLQRGGSSAHISGNLSRDDGIYYSQPSFETARNFPKDYNTGSDFWKTPNISNDIHPDIQQHTTVMRGLHPPCLPPKPRGPRGPPGEGGQSRMMPT